MIIAELKKKMDAKEAHKEIDRLERLIENLNHSISDNSDKLFTLEKDCER